MADEDLRFSGARRSLRARWIGFLAAWVSIVAVGAIMTLVGTACSRRSSSLRQCRSGFSRDGRSARLPSCQIRSSWPSVGSPAPPPCRWLAIAVLVFVEGGAIVVLIELWTLRLGELAAATASLLPGAMGLFASLAAPVVILSVPASALFVVVMRIADRRISFMRAT